MTDFKENIAKELEKKDIGLTIDEIYKLIEIPPQDNMGDYSFPCFSLARTMRKNPAIIAEELASSLDLKAFEKNRKPKCLCKFLCRQKNV